MDVDLTDSRFVEDPYTLLEELRRAGPVHETFLGIRLVLPHEAVNHLNRDPHAGRDPRSWTRWEQVRPYLAGSALETTATRFMLNLDGAEHARLRDLVSRAFTPRTAAAMAATIAATTAELLDAMQARARDRDRDDGVIDVMAGLARPLPVRVILDLLGLPATDLPNLARWSHAAALSVEPTLRRPQAARAAEAVAELVGYLTNAVARRRARDHADDRRAGAGPADLLGAFLAAQAAGGTAGGAAGGGVGGPRPGGLRDDDELIAMLVLIFIAGHETTTNLLGNGLLALARHPDQWALLRSDPDRLAPAAVEELLRYDPPVQTNPRIPQTDSTIAGVPVPAGTLVLGMLGAANRDPTIFAHPDRLDITRSPNPHLTFGGGTHFCVGAGLARLEARIALAAAARRWPRLLIDHARLRRRPLVNLRGLEILPLDLTAADAPARA
jgi:cytochrome P450